MFLWHFSVHNQLLTLTARCWYMHMVYCQWYYPGVLSQFALDNQLWRSKLSLGGMTAIFSAIFGNKYFTMIFFSAGKLEWALQLSMKRRMHLFILDISLSIPFSQSPKILLVIQTFGSELCIIRNDLILAKHLNFLDHPIIRGGSFSLLLWLAVKSTVTRSFLWLPW